MLTSARREETRTEKRWLSSSHLLERPSPSTSIRTAPHHSHLRQDVSFISPFFSNFYLIFFIVFTSCLLSVRPYLQCGRTSFFHHTSEGRRECLCQTRLPRANSPHQTHRFSSLSLSHKMLHSNSLLLHSSASSFRDPAIEKKIKREKQSSDVCYPADVIAQYHVAIDVLADMLFLSPTSSSVTFPSMAALKALPQYFWLG